MPSPERITTSQTVTAACALDTVPLLAARVRNLLSWGRRITVAESQGGELTVQAGLVVADDMEQPVRDSVQPGQWATFGVHLAPGIHSFGFAAYASDGNATEMEVWRRYHAGDRRDITLVDITGGMQDRVSPGRADSLTVTRWNAHGVVIQTVIAFDTHAYSEVWREREERGFDLGGQRLDITYCDELAQVGRYRVRCGYPLLLTECEGQADHVTAPVAGGAT